MLFHWSGACCLWMFYYECWMLIFHLLCYQNSSVLKKKNLITQSIKAKMKWRVTELTVQLHCFFFMNLINIINLLLSSSLNNIAVSFSSNRDQWYTNGVWRRDWGEKTQRWSLEMDWKFPLDCVVGRSIALSRCSDLGLTPALARLALVSSASFTISRKLYPTLA